MHIDQVLQSVPQNSCSQKSARQSTATSPRPEVGVRAGLRRNANVCGPVLEGEELVEAISEWMMIGCDPTNRLGYIQIQNWI
jgi:hypothetical protein